MNELDSEVAGSSEDTRQPQLRTGDPYVDKSPQKKSRNVPSLIMTLLVKRHDGNHRLNKYGETRIGGSKREARNWFQSTSNNSKAMIRGLGNVELFEL